MSVEEWRSHIDNFMRGRMSDANFFNLEQAIMDIWLERRGG